LGDQATFATYQLVEACLGEKPVVDADVLVGAGVNMV
jgi:hypothetical protein